MTDQNRPATSIAIVGVSALFPGATDIGGFWRNILAGRDLITDVPPSHWLIEDYYDPDPAATDKTYGKRGGFLPAVDFEPMAFGVPPNNIGVTDTAQLLALIVAQQVLDDACQGQFASMKRDRVSVILGVASGTELLCSMASRMQRPVWLKGLRESGMPEDEAQAACDRIAANYAPWQEATFPGLLGNVVAGRIANRFDLHGTNCVTDAACASSLSSISISINELLLGQSDLVIAGGVDTLNDIMMYMCFSKTPALSPSGDCRPFSDAADGTMLGEGIGMFALKRLADAERDGDRVYAVIRGMGTSSDGRATAVYAPLPEGQARAIANAYEAAGYGPETVELVEAHGTGTKAGDLAEFNGLRRVFGDAAPGRSQWCALGSVKSQIGHTKAAAGAAGMLKAVLALHHKILPPTIKVERPNPKLDIGNSPFYLNTQARPWVRDASHPRRAAVSSFGFGGSNFHLTLEEYVPGANAPAQAAWQIRALPTELVVLHAAGGAELAQRCRDMLAAAPALADAARASQLAFDAGAPARLSLVAADADSLARQLAQAAELLDKQPQAAFSTPQGMAYRCGAAAPGKTAFLFSGQGSQYVGMGADVAQHFPAARAAWDDTAALRFDGQSLHNVVFPVPVFSDAERQVQNERLTATEWAQPALAAQSLALLNIARELGLLPSCVAGHSFGELVALHAAEAFDADVLLRLARKRGELMRDAGGTPGAMLAVNAARAEVEAELAKLGLNNVVLANHNAPKQVVVSGASEAITTLSSALEGAGLRVRRLPVATAFHSPIVAGASEPLLAFLKDELVRSPRLDVYANTNAAPYPADSAAIGAQLAAQLRLPVEFVEQIEAMYASGVRTFIEIGAGSVLSELVGQILGERDHLSLSLDRKNKNGVTSLQEAVGRLSVAGLALDFGSWWRGHAEPRSVPAGKKPAMVTRLNGANYNKPYPPVGGAAGLPAPNPPRAAVVQQAVAPAAQPAIAAAAGIPAAAATPAPVAAAALSTIAPSAAPSVQAIPAHAHAQAATLPFATLVPAATPTAPGAVAAAAPDPAPATLAAPAPAAAPANNYANGAASSAVSTGQASLAWLHAFESAQRQTADAHATFQTMMADSHMAFLKMAEQSNANFAILSGATGNAAALAASAVAPMPAATHAAAIPVPAVAYEAPAAMPAMAHQAPAGVPMTSLAHQAAAGVPLPSAAHEAPPALSVPTQATPAGAAMPAVAHAAPGAAAIPAQQVAQAHATPAMAMTADLEALMLSVVADKTGYPTDMLGMDMQLEADLGIDSIKRVEILSALREMAPGLGEISPAELGKLRTLGEIVAHMRASAPAGAKLPPADLEALMLSVVADKTGYPTDMLGMDMQLEADLGIDSIKRVEILSALRELAPGLGEISPAELGKLRTLGEIVEHMRASAPAASPAPASPVVSISLPAPAAPATGAGHAVAAAANAPAGATLPPADLETLMLSVVADKTGYPTEMLGMDMQLEADLGIDSIKRVEILSAVRDLAPGLSEISPAELGKLRTLGEIVAHMRASAPATSSAHASNVAPVSSLVVSAPAAGVGQATTTVASAQAVSSLPPADLEALMLSVVADKTGYPTEMLGMDMQLEADLGIDSIKRVEILSAVRDLAPGLSEISPAELGKLRTLGEIVAHMRASAPAAGPVPATATNDAADKAAAAGSAVPSAPPPALRFALRALPAPAPGVAMKGLLTGKLVVTDDGGGIAGLVAASLAAQGYPATAVDTVPGDATGVIFLGGLRAIANREEALRINQEAFSAARAIAPALERDGGLFVAVQDTGGDFGLSGRAPERAWSGGLAALVLTAVREWPLATLKTIDCERGARDAAAVAEAIVAELTAGGPALEVGLPEQAPRLNLVSLPVPLQPEAAARIGKDSVLVVTGGARGVTAAALVALARAHQPKLVLIGRTALTEEPVELRGIADEAKLKQALIAHMKANAAKVSPAQISAELARLLAVREVRATLETLAHAGSPARYLALDVQDSAAMNGALDEVRRTWGAITGIVHGAGVLADRRIADKTDAQFAHVFNTKVQGLQALLAATAGDPLSVICLFSSIAARTGNVGQCDYAMANEVLNQVASAERARRGDCLVRSIGWGPWQGGMVTSTLAAHFAREGVALLSLDEGTQAFVGELGASPSDVRVVVLPAAAQTGALGAPEGPAAGLASELAIDLAPASHGYLHDHSIAGTPVVPVALALEWLARGARVWHPLPQAMQLRQVRVLRKVALDEFAEGGSRRLRVRSKLHAESAHGSLALELAGADDALHYRAVVTPGAQVSAQAGQAAPAALAPLQRDALYDGHVLFHGPRFQAIAALDGIAAQGAAATLTGAAALGWPAEGWQTDPALIDGGLQLAVLWAEPLLGGAALPMSVDDVRLHRAGLASGPVRCVVHARQVYADRASCDISFHDADGAVRAEMLQVELILRPGEAGTGGARMAA
ncbi:SDR family oxidoreductase [Pseudoduganella sp. LjRoot289]|uniref:SDR family NAD(P)-dependent oxidoreductase n=1 Tax=Pseudoduganella sp. LjRoot289 TaxID=3342314 RepID=UPI003ECD1264